MSRARGTSEAHGADDGEAVGVWMDRRDGGGGQIKGGRGRRQGNSATERWSGGTGRSGPVRRRAV